MIFSTSIWTWSTPSGKCCISAHHAKFCTNKRSITNMQRQKISGQETIQLLWLSAASYSQCPFQHSVQRFLSNHYIREEIAVHTHVVEHALNDSTHLMSIAMPTSPCLWFFMCCSTFFRRFSTHPFISTLLSAMLYFFALSTYYHYLNFLSYDVLPSLERTTFLLYPIGLLALLLPISWGQFIYGNFFTVPEGMVLGEANPTSAAANMAGSAHSLLPLR